MEGMEEITEQISLPYGRGLLQADISKKRIRAVLNTKLNRYVPEFSEEELVRKSLEHPIGSKRLRELARGRQRIVVITSDHTRPVPSRITMPLILSEIREGNPGADITILVATGCHRGMTEAEMSAKFGGDIVGKEKIVVHDCDDREQLVDLGYLPSGGRLILNRLAAEADLLVAEGFIEPHFFAGFSGGRKSVLPGVAARETVLYNHNSAFIADSCARTGRIQGNPLHRDMLYAARRAGLAFIVNVVLNSDHIILNCFSGDCDQAHIEGRKWLLPLCKVSADPSDIVIVTNGGYPLDQNIYQAVKGMTAAETIVKKGGVIIMAARSEDGHGGEAFYRTFREEADEDRILEKFLKTPAERTIVDQWQSQIFARVLKKARVVYISDMPGQLVREMHMIPAGSVEEGIRTADRLLGREDSLITVIVDGVSVITECSTMKGDICQNN